MYPRAGWVEHDADEIWANTLAVTHRLITRHPDLDLLCVSIANQRETVVAFDKRTGRPLAPAIVWQCRRGDSLCARQTGCRARSGDSSATQGCALTAIFLPRRCSGCCEEHPDIARLVASGDALIGTIDTYLIYRLTGCGVYATDATNASRTLLFDIHRLTWDEELCRWWQRAAGGAGRDTSE